MLNLTLSPYRGDGGLYYQVLIQRWLLEQENFKDYNEFLDRVTEWPKDLTIYWRHLTEKPEGWDAIENFDFPEGSCFFEDFQLILNLRG